MFLWSITANAKNINKLVYSLLWLKRKLHLIWSILSSDVTHWQSCIVGNVGTTKRNVWNKKKWHLWLGQGNIHIIMRLYMVLVDITYITHNAT